LNHLRLELIKAKLPGLAVTIAAETNIPLSTVSRALEDMRASKQCHIGGWKQLPNGSYVARYVEGEGRDATCHFLAPSKILHLPERMAAYVTPPSFETIVFDSLPDHSVGIRKTTELSRSAIVGWLQKLHKAGRIHIYRWMRHPSNGTILPMYSPHPGTDVPCNLKTLTPEEQAERKRDRVRILRIREEMNRRREARKAASAAKREAKAQEKQKKVALAQQKKQSLADGTWKVHEDSRKQRELAQEYVNHALQHGDPLLNHFFGLTKNPAAAKKASSLLG
jgi:hypothetical protein